MSKWVIKLPYSEYKESINLVCGSKEENNLAEKERLWIYTFFSVWWWSISLASTTEYLLRFQNASIIHWHHSKASLWVPTRDAYCPLRANNSSWLPNSTILPPEQTAIWWAFCTVLSLWAITNVVLPFIKCTSACCTRRSLSASNALVAWRHEEPKDKY